MLLSARGGSGVPQEKYDTLKEDYEALQNHLGEQAAGTEKAEQSSPTG